jgi:hypothetical protein
MSDRFNDLREHLIGSVVSCFKGKTQTTTIDTE